MKYQVQIQYTNPSHEHVSLRRRVESITRVVEAANETEALNRAANQQRSLGFLIKEAAVMNTPKEENLHADEKEKKKKKVVGDDNEETDIAASGGVKEAAGGTESYPLLKKGEKLKPMKLKMSEEVEEVEEAKKPLKPSYWKAEWRLGTQSEVDKNNKKIYDRLAKTDPDKAKKFHDNLMKIRKEELEQTDEAAKDWKKAFQKVAAKNYEKDVAAVRSSASRLDKATQSFPAKPDTKPTDSNIEYVKHNVRKGVTKPHSMQEEVVTEASKEGKDVMRNMRASLKSMDLRHGVDSDKREAGYKMSPAVKAAQAKSDALSKKIKRPQAGTLAAVHKSMERDMMKKEATENNGKQKARKAAEKMVNRAKGKANKINMTPEMEPGKPND